MPEYYFWGPARVLQRSNPLIVWYRAIRPQGIIGGKVGFNPYNTNPSVAWRNVVLGGNPAVATIVASGSGAGADEALPPLDVNMPDRIVFAFDGTPHFTYFGSGHPDPVDPLASRRAIKVDCSGAPLVSDPGGGLFPFTTTELQHAQRIDVWVNHSEDPVEPTEPVGAMHTQTTRTAKPTGKVKAEDEYLRVPLSHAEVLADRDPTIVRVATSIFKDVFLSPPKGRGVDLARQFLPKAAGAGLLLTVSQHERKVEAKKGEKIRNPRFRLEPERPIEGDRIEWILCGDWRFEVQARDLVISAGCNANLGERVRVISKEGAITEKKVKGS